MVALLLLIPVETVTWSNNYCAGNDNDNQVTIDTAASWEAFWNVSNTNLDGDQLDFVFGGGLGADLPFAGAVLDAENNTITLRPNRINDPNPFWQTGNLLGNKYMDISSFVTDGSLANQAFTFGGTVNSNTLDAEYDAIAFIRVFNADFSAILFEVTAPLDGDTFALTYNGDVADAAFAQYGFNVQGRNVNPDPSFDAGYEALGNIVIGALENGSSDDCVSLSDACGATGSATVTFTATDECGNTTSTTATFTIEDTMAPEVTDAMDMVVECDGEGNVDALEAWLASYGGATATDACSEVEWTNNFTGLSDDCGATGSATVTFTATDDCGNSESTTATFTIQDTTTPEFTYVPEDLVLECDEEAPVENAEAGDICGSAEVTYEDYYTNTPWRAFTSGNGSVDLTNTPDGFVVVGSNQGTFDAPWLNVGFTSVKNVLLSFDWEYVNNDVPGFDDLVLIVNGEIVGSVQETASGTVSDLELSAGDQFAIGIFNGQDDCCGEATVTVSNINFEINNQCPVTDCFIREFTATDECGNVAYAEQLIVFQDTTAPVIEPAAMDMTVECDGNGNVEQLNAWLDSNGGASATDNCSEVTWSNDFESLDDKCGATGSAVVTFTATDVCGNTSTTSALFVIEDTTPPSIDEPSKDLTVECDGSGNASDLAAWLDNNGGAVASDMCGDVDWTNDFEALSDDCGATGSATVTFTATDDCGNTASSTATFTIEDTTCASC